MTASIILSILLLSILYGSSINAERRVIITGAGGRTGSIVFKKLLESKIFTPIGIVRTKKSSKQLLKKGGGTESNVKIADITDVTALENAFIGADSLILCTSAVPQINYLSLLKVFILKLFRKTARPSFRFIPNGDPYNVDWLGAKNQIDAAKKAGIKNFIFLSSMGGTQPENFLNTIGRVDSDEKSGNILLWKRKAEEYLIASGLTYTIIHPGGLTDKKGGVSEIVFGINDELLKGNMESLMITYHICMYFSQCL